GDLVSDQEIALRPSEDRLARPVESPEALDASPRFPRLGGAGDVEPGRGRTIAGELRHREGDAPLPEGRLDRVGDLERREARPPPLSSPQRATSTAATSESSTSYVFQPSPAGASAASVSGPMRRPLETR